LFPFRQRISHEDTLFASFAYLWLAADQLQLCQQAYRCDSFLLEVFQRVYRSLLVAGQPQPFPAVAYLSLGYTFHIIHMRERNRAPAEARQCVDALNRWLSESLQYEKVTDQERYNWVALEQFVHRSFAEIALAASRNTGKPSPALCDGMLPAICDSDKLSRKLRDIETQPLTDPYSQDDENIWRRARRTTKKTLEALADQINAALMPQPRGKTETEKRLHIAADQQAHAVRYYLGRAGVALRIPPSSEATSEREVFQPPEPRQQILDLHALAGYQTYGRFLPDTQTDLLLEQLRRRRSDPIVTRQSQEASVEGTTRRGRITELLKWQLALPEAYRYDRFFNHKMLYLRRISEKSRDIYVTFLLIIDLSAPASLPVLAGSRRHSIAREMGAHFLQDCYQVLYQVPRLYADAIVVMHDGRSVVWEGTLVLADGTQIHPAGVREDLFLQDRPLWLARYTRFADPATYFHFQLPALRCTAQSDDGYPLSIEDQCVDSVRRVRRDRATWSHLPRSQETAQVIPSPLSDLMVTIAVPARHLSDREIARWLEPMAALALEHRLWACECGVADGVDHQVDLRLFAERPMPWRDWQSLAGFQGQAPTCNSNPPTGLRQTFVQTLLRTLLDLYADVETG
jgi:hypothetical protein